MAKTNAVWGIDIGQCSLKALRCTPGEDGKMVADAFDYIEYPKILSQPDANPEELIREALEQFLSRNEVTGDKVAISVSGQAGLSRFFKPPPVDAKTLPDIVKFEARQQIPFALEDVIWDFQQIGGKVVDGVTVDAEVGLFAMKREAVFKALQPFLDADIEVDVVQLSPLTIYNVVLNDILTNLPDPEDWDPENPPESLVVVAMGTDTTDLVITDGYKLWLRNIPIGGNHFTKQLSRELKLTYAKAEHLKRNARRAEDPKTIFQAMRAVFSDLVTEIQRSISYFQGIERSAKIGHVVMFGNASNLPGLRQYLNKHLGIEISKVNEFRSLNGSSVLGSKQFQENFLSFATCYGLCLQAAGESRLKTNLLPQQFLTERLIRSKKPWALAGLAALMLGFSLNYFLVYGAWKKVNPETAVENVSWEQAKGDVENVNKMLNNYVSTDQQQMTMLREVHEIEKAVTEVTGGRRLWSEILSTLHQVLPPYPPANLRPTDEQFQAMMSSQPVDPNEVPYVDRPQIYVEYVETEYYPNLKDWWTDEVSERFERDEAYLEEVLGGPVEGGDEQATGSAATPGAGAGGVSTPDPGPQGPGWVIEIKGYHFFNGKENTLAGRGAGNYVRRTIIQRILDPQARVWLPVPPELEVDFVRFSPKEMGLAYPVLIVDNRPDLQNVVPNVNHPSFSAGGGMRPGAGDGSGGAGAGLPGAGGDRGGAGDSAEGDDSASEEPLNFEAPRHDFVLQMVWVPTTLRERLEAREERRKKREQEAAQAANQAGSGQPNNGGGPAGSGTGSGNPGAANPGGANPGGANPANKADDAAGQGAAGQPGAGQPGAGQPGAGQGAAGAGNAAPGDAGSGNTGPDGQAGGNDPAAGGAGAADPADNSGAGEAGTNGGNPNSGQ